MDFSDGALVVLGHGTTLNDQSAEPVLQHVAELRRRRIFREVYPAFWKQEPNVQEVLAQISAPFIFIVPLFISEGYFSTEVIPRELGFKFPERLTLETPTSRVCYCHPVGSHPAMTNVILARAAAVVKQFPFPRAPKPAETTLFVAGHGTERNEISRQAVENQVALIRTQNLYLAVHPIFMEEDPRISDCYAMALTKNMVVVPFFISDGLHAVEDIPVLLGEPEKIVKQRLAAGQPTWRNPTEKKGKFVWYSSSIGSEPLLADVILQRATEAATAARAGVVK
jgi:sirohydrochlorin cobaltochelatase